MKNLVTKLSKVMTISFIALMAVFAPLHSAAAAGAPNPPASNNTATTSGSGLGTDIYNKSTGDEATVNDALVKIIKWVAGVGGSVFVLACLIIAILIMAQSISAQKQRTAWVALFSCAGGAVVFFLAYKFADMLKAIAQ